MPKDLRGFIAEIEADYPEEVARVTKPISPRYEITALLTQLERRKRFPLLFCENVAGCDAPVAINVQASRKLMAVALECKPNELADRFSKRQSKPIPPSEISDAPVHEVIRTGAELDLTKIPLLTHYDVNAAPYITAGIVVAADPDTGVRNTSYNRLMLAGKTELRIFMAIGRHLWTLHNKMERRSEPLPIAIVVGVHPLFSLGAQAFTPSTEDEYAVIGGMLAEPLRVVPAKTVPIALRRGDTLSISVGDVGKATIASFRDQAGKAASVQGTAAQGAFQSASMEIANCKETRWADPDMRAWQGDSATVHRVSWNG